MPWSLTSWRSSVFTRKCARHHVNTSKSTPLSCVDFGQQDPHLNLRGENASSVELLHGMLQWTLFALAREATSRIVGFPLRLAEFAYSRNFFELKLTFIDILYATFVDS